MQKVAIAAGLALAAALAADPVLAQETAPPTVTEAPTGFDGLTNGYLTQADFDGGRDVFALQYVPAEGVGPVYNAQSCLECHGNPAGAGGGGISQVTNLRAGHFNGVNFVEHLGGSLINDRAIDADIQERVLGGNEVRTFRTSLNTLGDGFVECIDSNTLLAISNAQPANLRGRFIQVPVLEAGGVLRGGRFGWKNQHSSLTSFVTTEFLDQIGLTSPLQQTDSTVNGQVISDGIPDPELTSDTVDLIVAYLRSTKAPPRDTALAATANAIAGANLFNAIGCAICHTPSIVTAPPGTAINGGAFVVPPALGNKRIRPYSDFLLHNIGTGDGIVQNGGQSTRNRLRTPPLWGMRSRNRLMHDGNTLNRNEAILRHAGQAAGVINSYRALTTNQQNQLITFLNSL